MCVCVAVNVYDCPWLFYNNYIMEIANKLQYKLYNKQHSELMNYKQSIYVYVVKDTLRNKHFISNVDL